MKFCEKCGSTLQNELTKTDYKTKLVLKCYKCGWETKPDSDKPEKTVIDNKEQIDIIEKEDQKDMPTIEINCPKCSNRKAYWWMLQTRSGDEPTTQFFRCLKCKHTWRQYS